MSGITMALRGAIDGDPEAELVHLGSQSLAAAVARLSEYAALGDSESLLTAFQVKRYLTDIPDDRNWTVSVNKRFLAKVVDLIERGPAPNAEADMVPYMVRRPIIQASEDADDILPTVLLVKAPPSFDRAAQAALAHDRAALTMRSICTGAGFEMPDVPLTVHDLEGHEVDHDDGEYPNDALERVILCGELCWSDIPSPTENALQP